MKNIKFNNETDENQQRKQTGNKNEVYKKTPNNKKEKNTRKVLKQVFFLRNWF